MRFLQTSGHFALYLSGNSVQMMLAQNFDNINPLLSMKLRCESFGGSLPMVRIPHQSRAVHRPFYRQNFAFWPPKKGPVLCRIRESVRFASIWTSITCPIFPSNFLSGFSDFSLKIEYLKNPFFITFLIDKWPIWAVSSAGRARRSHRRGRGFDPLTVHQNWKSLWFLPRRFLV